MKTELKSKSRRKWIIGGVAVFGSVALLTTGFATWIVGVMITNADHATSVSVDSTNNESLRLTMTSSDLGISVSETYAGDSTSKITSNGSATDFQISFSSIKLEVSPSFLVKYNISNISFSFGYDVTGVADDKTDNNKITLAAADEVGREAGNYTYLDIDAASTIDLSGVVWGDIEASGGFKTHEITSKDVALLKWGTYFGNSSPCTYYNGLGITWTNTVVDAVSNQMSALETAFNGGKIVVTATVNYVVKS